MLKIAVVTELLSQFCWRCELDFFRWCKIMGGLLGNEMHLQQHRGMPGLSWRASAAQFPHCGVLSLPGHAPPGFHHCASEDLGCVGDLFHHQ